MVIDRSTFALKALSHIIRKYSHCPMIFYNLCRTDALNDILRTQRITDVPEGIMVEKAVDKPCLASAYKNTRKSILKDFQIIMYQDGEKTGFIINPISKMAENLNDLPANWFEEYLSEISH